MKKMFLLACAGRGVQASSIDKPVSETEPPVLEQFRLIKETGLWDFFDRIPADDRQADEFVTASERYGVPIVSGSWTYQLGKDEAVIRTNLERAKRVGSTYHNLMIWAKHAENRLATDQEIIDSYLWVFDYAKKLGITITYENHADMWSEDSRRVSRVADAVRRRGIPFNFCMDYSHCIFKIENEMEQAVAQMRDDRDAVRRFDPYNDDSFADEWLKQNMVVWTQVRPAAPNGPPNWWAFETGPRNGLSYDRPGRSIQYPFRNPRPGEWPTAEWHAHKLACTKEVVRKVIDHYLATEDAAMRIMTIDNINLPAYGLGWRYNMYQDSCAVARYVRELYAERAAIFEAKQRSGSPEKFVAQYRA